MAKNILAALTFVLLLVGAYGSASRQYWQQPGTNNNIWNTPFGENCLWGLATDADTIDLRNGGYINAPDNYGSPVWVSQSASNPTANFQGSSTNPGGVPVQFNINPHLIAGSYGAGPYTAGSVDEAYNFIDTVGYPGMYLFAGPLGVQNFEAGQGPFYMADGALGVMDATTDLFSCDYELQTGMYIQSAGVIRGYDIDPTQNDNFMPGTNIPAIRHMLRYSHDPKYLKRNDVNGANGALNADAWPKTFEDYQGGNTPGNLYYGNLLYGTTVGIPINIAMPSGLSTAGQQIFWTLQHYGALIRDVSGGGFHLFADQDVCSNSQWYNDANNDLPTIVQYLAPLRNQHVGGQNFADHPANGPGSRVDVGPPPLALLNGFPRPSPSNTVVQAGSNGAFTDSFGNVWSINSNHQVAVNGVADSATSNVAALAFVTGVIYYKSSTTGQWYCKTATWNSWSPGTTTDPTSSAPTLPPSGTPPPTQSASPSGTLITAGSGASIRDASGNVWTITSGGQVSVNNVVDTNTGNVIALAYVNGLVWQENSDKMWWSKSSPTAAWSPSDGTSVSPLPATSAPTPRPTPRPTSRPTPPPTPKPTSASPSGTVVLAGSGGSIRDQNGNVWTITSGGQVAVNGVTDTTTGNVIELAYVNGIVWQENTGKMWWGKSSPSAAWSPTYGTSTSPLPATPAPTPRPPTPAPTHAPTPPPTRPPTPRPPTPRPPTPPPTHAPTHAPTSAAVSPSGTVVKAGSGGAIHDKNGNVWTITASGQVSCNGVVDSGTGGVIELAYVNGVVWQENNNKMWWGKSSPSAAWSPEYGTSVSPVTPTASPSGTVVLAGTSNSITDASGNVWTITANKQVAVNGVADTSTGNVVELAYVNGIVWQENTASMWWGKTSPSAAWAPNYGTSQSPL